MFGFGGICTALSEGMTVHLYYPFLALESYLLAMVPVHKLLYDGCFLRGAKQDAVDLAAMVNGLEPNTREHPTRLTRGRPQIHGEVIFRGGSSQIQRGFLVYYLQTTSQ